jgi:hypothetical protein
MAPSNPDFTLTFCERSKQFGCARAQRGCAGKTAAMCRDISLGEADLQVVGHQRHHVALHDLGSHRLFKPLADFHHCSPYGLRVQAAAGWNVSFLLCNRCAGLRLGVAFRVDIARIRRRGTDSRDTTIRSRSFTTEPTHKLGRQAFVVPPSGGFLR